MDKTPLDIRKLPGAEVLDFVNGSYIARRFFKHSRSWFFHRVNNNIVNGKPASFNYVELLTLRTALLTMCNEIKEYASNLPIDNKMKYKDMDFIEKTIEEGIKVVGSYACLELGVKLFQNDDNTFDVCAYHYMQGDWMPLGDAEEENHFATESEAIEYGISIIKDQTDYWDWALSEECTNERIKTTVCQNLDISPGMKPILHLY